MNFRSIEPFISSIFEFYNSGFGRNTRYWRCRWREEGNEHITRFCNQFDYLRSIPGFADIIGIVEFYWNGAVVNGIFVERLSTLGNAFKASHIHNVKFSSNRMFINTNYDTPIPAIWKPPRCRSTKYLGDRLLRQIPYSSKVFFPKGYQEEEKRLYRRV